MAVVSAAWQHCEQSLVRKTAPKVVTASQKYLEGGTSYEEPCETHGTAIKEEGRLKEILDYLPQMLC